MLPKAVLECNISEYAIQSLRAGLKVCTNFILIADVRILDVFKRMLDVCIKAVASDLLSKLIQRMALYKNLSLSELYEIY